MSDTPLFQNSDEQEAVYGGTPQPTTADREDAVPPLVVPAAGVLGGGLAGAVGPGAGTAGTGVPAAAGTALAADTEEATSTRAPVPGAIDDLDDTTARR